MRLHQELMLAANMDVNSYAIKRKRVRAHGKERKIAGPDGKKGVHC